MHEFLRASLHLWGWNIDLASAGTRTFAGLFAALLFASVFIAVTNFSAKTPKAELTARTNTWWLIVGQLFLALHGPKWFLCLYFAVVSFLALREFFQLAPLRESDLKLRIWMLVVLLLQYFLVWYNWYGLFIVLIPVWTFLLIPMRMIVAGNTTSFLKSLATIQWGLMATVFSISHLAFFNNIVLRFEYMGVRPVNYILLVVILTELNDVFQFIAGKSFGKNKIVPHVSPGKTWEGFWGGVIGSTGLSLLLSPYLVHMPLYHAALFGCLCAVVGFFGDVTESAIKRDIGVKDSGHLLPGHGGILDRIDSLVFTALFSFHYVHYFFGK